MRTYYKVFCSVLALLSLAACSVERPSHVTSQEIQLIKTVYEKNYLSSEITPDLAARIAAEFKQYGEGPMTLHVNYDPASKVNTEAVASHELARISNIFRTYGIKNPVKGIVALPGSGDVSTVYISYHSLKAGMDETCRHMPGFDNPAEAGSVELMEQYQYGCTVNDLLASQIADPADLLGHDGFKTPADGRRAENVVAGRGYYGYEPFPPLNTEATTGD